MKRKSKNKESKTLNKALFQLKQCLFFIVLTSQTFAQIPTNTWRMHADYFNAKGIEVVEKNKIYCFSKNGFFYFNKTTNQTVKLSKLNNLSETIISQIKYNSGQKALVIAYETGNIDLMTITSEGLPDKIQNIDFIKKTDAIQDSKAINQIEFRGDFAYLAADFGLVVLDVKKNEIKETYQNIGKEGRKVAVKQIAFARDSIFVNTSGGILGAKFAPTTNLQFFGNWNKVINDQLFKSPVFPKDNLIVFPNELETDGEGKIWIADGENGLLGNFSGSFKSYSPNGVKGDIFSVFYQNQTIYTSGIAGNAFVDNLWTNPTINQTPSNKADIIDQYGYRWQLTGQILKVTDPITNRNRFYSSTFELPGNYINTIALDHDNLLWVGTNNGVAIIIPSKDIFTNNIKPYTPFFQTRRLLLQEVVNKIVIDGGNRKWIATQNGLNLFSASADEQILNFTAENSPLPSKNVIDLAINDNSGEIFVLTQNGLLSYRTDSSEPSEDLSSVKIFPNPVRPDFQGVLTVSGLRENTAIKITDTAGRLIYETKSNGGTASWDLQNHQATTAIYMVFCVAEDGSESFVGKLAVLR
jgi:ligand-binding sensor domain-containing protein